MHFIIKDGRKRQLTKKHEREMKTYVMNIGMIYRNSPHTILFMWMNRDVINVLASEEQDDRERDSFVAEWKHAVSYRLGRVFA